MGDGDICQCFSDMEKSLIPQLPMYFCIRDDDTSYFTAPDDLDAAYGEITKWGPVSLAVVPFHRAGDSKGVPEKYRGRWTVHPLHENMDLVQYLRTAVAAGRFEIMLHGYYHDERETRFEFTRRCGTCPTSHRRHASICKIYWTQKFGSLSLRAMPSAGRA